MITRYRSARSRHISLLRTCAIATIHVPTRMRNGFQNVPTLHFQSVTASVHHAHTSGKITCLQRFFHTFTRTLQHNVVISWLLLCVDDSSSHRTLLFMYDTTAALKMLSPFRLWPKKLCTSSFRWRDNSSFSTAISSKP